MNARAGRIVPMVENPMSGSGGIGCAAAGSSLKGAAIPLEDARILWQ